MYGEFVEADDYDQAIVQAAEEWWNSYDAGGKASFLNQREDAPIRSLAQMVYAKQEAEARAREFGPTPAEDSDIPDSEIVDDSIEEPSAAWSPERLEAEIKFLHARIDGAFESAQAQVERSDALQIRMDNLQQDASRLEQERLELTVRVNQICSFLGPAFQEWKSR